MCKKLPEKPRYHIYLSAIVKLIPNMMDHIIMQAAARALAEKQILRNAELPKAELIKAAFAGFMQLESRRTDENERFQAYLPPLDFESGFR